MVSSITKTLVIFDLDDTLVDTSDVYYQARTSFAHLMKDEGFDIHQVIQVFEDIDTRHLQQFGHSPERYSKSMLTTYRELMSASGKVEDPKLVKRVEKCGMMVIEVLPNPIIGAIELIKWAAEIFSLALLTRGIESLQLRKVQAADLLQYFPSIRTVESKDMNTVLRFVRDLGHAPEMSWMVGDSIKSDINPGIEAGLSCILYRYRHHEYTWIQEYGASPVGPFHVAEDLSEVKDILQKNAN